MKVTGRTLSELLLVIFFIKLFTFSSKYARLLKLILSETKSVHNAERGSQELSINLLTY